MPSNHFNFRHFDIVQQHSPARVGTDGTLLGAWVKVEGAKRIMDIGTGTGLIALMLAQRNRQAVIIAIEKHEAAAKEAEMNFANSPWPDRLSVMHLDFRDFTSQTEDGFDLIVSNPPYFRNDTPSQNEDRNSWRKQDHLSIDALMRVAAENLVPQGRLALVLPIREAVDSFQVAADLGLSKARVCEVHFKPEKPAKRILVEFLKGAEADRDEGKAPVQEEKLIIQVGGRHEYSEEYIALTRDFYPWM